VITVADERGAAGDAVSSVGRRRLQGAAELGGDQDVRSTAVDLLGSFVGETATEEGPVQRILQGPRRSRVVATDLLTDEGAGNGVGLQPSERTGSCPSDLNRRRPSPEDSPGSTPQQSRGDRSPHRRGRG